MLANQLFRLDRNAGHSLQKQIMEQIASAIIGGHIPVDRPLPSSRSLAGDLKVGRNTVILAYERLLSDGYLISRERSGYFVNPEILGGAAVNPYSNANEANEPSAHRPDWPSRFQLFPSEQHNIRKPQDWRKYPYPFIYGQIGDDLFPLNHWRECCRDGVSVRAVRDWSADSLDSDDPLLIEQIRSRLLPRRGVRANPEQILVTVGAQQALYLIAQLMLDAGRCIGLEEPGYVDVRNISRLGRAEVKSLAIDADGLIVSDELRDCDYIYVTPSHQSPTTVTMPLDRREQLLEIAADADIVLIEDDYESEFNFQSNPLPSLKSLDKHDRVIYVGSLSKTISPGLRMGYMVGPEELIRELRSLRRLMVRHPAANNQHSVALFLARGYQESLVRTLRKTYAERSQIMAKALTTHMSDLLESVSAGGSSCWIQGPGNLDTEQLAARALDCGIIIEPGTIHFQQIDPPRQYFRLGFSAIRTDQIEPGIKRLASLLHGMPGTI